MTPVFLNTVGLLGLWDMADQRDAAALTNDRHFQAAGSIILF